MKSAEAREEARRAAAKYEKMASYIAAAMKILAEDSEDDTDHEDTPTPPAFTSDRPSNTTAGNQRRRRVARKGRPLSAPHVDKTTGRHRVTLDL